MRAHEKKVFRQILTLSAAFAALLSVNTGLSAASGPESLKLTTVVLDAGHGGTDPGAVSKDGKTKEKNLTLAISKKVGEKINAGFPEVKVVYTRPDDKFVTLGSRAEIANRNRANLFISFHINSFDTSRPDGFSTHILGESSKKDTDLFEYNMNVCKKENSVMLLEDDYTTKYQGFDPNDPESFIFFHLMQNAFYEQSLLFAADVNNALGSVGFRHNRGIHQDPFFVLWKTTMPSVLIESGFISNDGDLAVLLAEDGVEKIAEAVYQAFKVFKARYDGSTDVNAGEAKAAPEPEKPVVEPPVKAQEPEKPAEEPEKPAVELPQPKDTAAIAPAAVETPEPAVKEPQLPQKRFGVQVLVSSKNLALDDPYFGGRTARAYKADEVYKYVVCETATEEEVKKIFPSVQKDFEDCFMVKIDGEKLQFWGRR